MGTRKEERGQRKAKERSNRVRKELAQQREKQLHIQRIKRNYNSKQFSKIASLPRSDRDYVLRRVVANDSLRSPLLPNPFPATYAECALKRSSIYSPNLRSAISLTGSILRAYRDRVSLIYEQVDRYYEQVATHDLLGAKRTLANVQTGFGVSLWLIEATLLVGELSDGVEGNREFLSSVYEQEPAQRVALISTFKSQRVERELPASSYCGYVNGFIQDVRNSSNDVPEQELAEVLYNLNFHSKEVPDHLPFILDHARAYSLLDTALAFRTTVPFYAADSRVADTLPKKASVIDDAEEFLGAEKSSLLRFWLGEYDRVHLGELAKKHAKAEQMLLDGRYGDARDLCEQQIKEHPTCFDFYLVNAQACHLGDLEIGDLFPPASVAQQVLACVAEAEAFGEKTSRCLNELAKIAYMLGNSEFAHRIMTYWTSKLNYDTHFPEFWLTSLPCILPWISFSMTEEQRAAAMPLWNQLEHSEWIRRFRNADYVPHPSTTRFRHVGLDRRFVLWFDAMLDLEIGATEIASKRYSQLRRFANKEYFLAKTLHAKLKQYEKSNDVVEIFNETSFAFIAQPSFLEGSPSRLLSKVWQGSESLRGNSRLSEFSWPITYWLATKDLISESVEYNLWVAVDEFMSKQGVRTLSEYLRPNPEPKPQLLCFLMHVCTSKVLRRNYKLKTREDQQNERVHILQYILQHDAIRYKQLAQDEITEINRLELLHDAIQDVEIGRIFVNTEGFKPKFSDENAQRFDRFDRLRRVPDAEMRKTVDLKGVTLRQTRRVRYTDYTVALFEDLVDEIRDEFIGNPSHGLNTYVSVHIRHGYISSQIRGQFDARRLATRQAPDGEYQDNDFWMNRFSEIEEPKREVINRRMKVFSSQLDDLVEEVNSEWIRIKSDEYPCGMFDFAMDENERALLFVWAAQKPDHHSFVDFVIDYLWEKTEASLKNIRYRITGDLLSDALQLLHDLEHDVLEISPKVAETDFSAVIAACGNEVQADFRLFAEWFRRSSGPVLDNFNFDLVLDVATKTAKQFHPGKDFELERHVIPERFEGSWFKPFVEIMVILFDNLLKNARTGVFRPKCILTFDGKNTLSMLIENALGEAVDVDALRTKVDAINEEGLVDPSDHAKLQSEGNSGIPKIRKLVKEDLRQRESKVVCSVTSEGSFRVFIEMNSIKVIGDFQ